MTMRRIALQASLALDHKRRWKRAVHHAAKHYKSELHVGQPLWFWRRGANSAKRPTSAFWHPGVVISNTLATVWIAFRGSVVKCARSLVPPFTEDDEAGHEHITEHMRDLGERSLHEGDFSYEDITGHEESPVDLPTYARKTQTDQPRTTIGSTCKCTSPDTTQKETKEDHDDKRRRIDEPESTVPTDAQDEVLAPCPVPCDSDTRDDEVAVDVPLLEETAEMSGENSQGSITEEAFFTVSPGARQVRQRKEVQMNQLSPAERHEFLKSMEVEWQTLLKNQAAKVLSLEENGTSPSALAGSCYGHPLGPYLEARRQQAIGAPCQGKTHYQGFCRPRPPGYRITFSDTYPGGLHASYGDASGGSTRAEQAQAGYEIMFADRALLGGMAVPVTPVSWRSHSVKRVVASGSAAEAMGLSEGIAQGDWVRALWSEAVLGLSLREWREQENVPPLISVTDSMGNYDHLHNETVGPSEDRRSAIDLAIIREDLSRPQMFLRWVDGKAQVADALTKLHGDGDLLRAVCRQAFTVLVEAPEIVAARRQEKRERERVPRVQSPLKLREPVDETSMSAATTTTVT